jgi:polyferredoxin
MKKPTLTQTMRYVVQWGMLLYLASISTTHMYRWPGTSAGPLDAYCPMGGLETLLPFVTSGQIVQGTNFNAILLLGALTILVLIFSGGFCGYMCPFGTVLEWVYKIRKLFWKKTIRLPNKLSSALSYARYGVLILIVLITFAIDTELHFAHIDPYRAFFHFGREMTTELWIVLGVIFGLSIVLERGFCAYLCPLGGYVGLVSLAGFTKIKNNGEKCIDCKLCDRACPVNLTPSGKLEHHRCIMCFRCVDACIGTKSLCVSLADKEWR